MNSNNISSPLPKLYSLKGLVLAAFLGSLIAGGILVYLNCAALNRKNRGIQIFGLIVVLWIALLAVIYHVPEFTGEIIVMGIVHGLLMFEIGRRIFRETYMIFESNNGTYYSLWRCVSISILVYLTLSLILFFL